MCICGIGTRTGVVYIMQGESGKTIYLIRHGITAFNALGKYMGRGIDEDLSSDGIRMIEEKRDGIRRLTEGSVVFSGPLKRAKNTAALIYYDRPVIIEDTLTEIDFGDFEGKSARELSDDPRYRQWIESDGTLTFPNGESIDDFRRRTMTSLHNILRRANDAEKIAIVCHGGCIMAIMSGLCGGRYHDYLIPNLDGYALYLTADDETITDITYDRITDGCIARSSDR